MRFSTAVIVGAASIACQSASAQDLAADSFQKIFLGTCMKYLPNLSVLKEKMRDLPKLPPEKAAHFLSGFEGEAWPLPDKEGEFVLALPAGKNICLVYARRLNVEAVRAKFEALVHEAPSPMTATQLPSRSEVTAASGATETVSFEWSAQNARRKARFILTTAGKVDAPMQAMASASLGE